MKQSFLSDIDQLKSQYKNTVFLFRHGDFYESYDCDAVRVSRILCTTLCHVSVTNEETGTETGTVCMTGFPFHDLDNSLPRLVRAGLRIAIADYE